MAGQRCFISERMAVSAAVQRREAVASDEQLRFASHANAELSSLQPGSHTAHARGQLARRSELKRPSLQRARTDGR